MISNGAFAIWGSGFCAAMGLVVLVDDSNPLGLISLLSAVVLGNAGRRIRSNQQQS